MRYVRQFLILILICFIGELFKWFIPLPIPAGIYGMVILFAALETGILKLSSIEETAKFLIDIMPIMFIPAGVGLISSWDAVKGIWPQVMIITIVSTVVVLGASGRITQAMMHREKKKHE